MASNETQNQSVLPTVPSPQVEAVPGTPAKNNGIDLSFINDIPDAPQSFNVQGPVQPNEPVVEPTVVSSDLARDDFKEEEVNQKADLAAMTEQLKAAEAELLKRQEAAAASESGEEETGITLTDEEREELGLGVGEEAPKTPEEIEAEKVAEITNRGKEEIEDILDVFDRQMALVDESTRAQVRSIKKLYRGVSRKQENANKRALESFKNFGIRVGSQRYAGEVNQGILNAEERAGIARLEEIAARMESAISNAETAGANKKYALFQQERAELAAARKDYKNEIQLLQANALEARTAAEEEIKTQERQLRIAEIIGGGVTSALDIFTELEGEVPFDEITEMVNELPENDEGESFTLGSMDIRYDGAGNVIARGSKVGGGGGTSTGGLGGGLGSGLSVGPQSEVVGPPQISGLGSSYDNSTLEAQLVIDDIVNGLPTQLINNVAEIPRWREAVRKQMQAGYSEQEVIDKLSGFRLFKDADKELGSTLYNLSVGSDVSPQDLSGLLNRGAETDAMVKIENSHLDKVQSFFAPVDKARSTVKQADTVLNLLNDPSFPADKLGLFDAAEFKFKRGANLTNEEDVKVQQLESALQLLNAPIRVEIVGTAATEAEMAKITGFQASISSQPDIVKTQVQELRDAVLRFHNEARSQRNLPTVNNRQLVDNAQRLDLYRAIGKVDSEVTNNTMPNYDFLDRGAWNGYTPANTVTSQDNSSFFNSY